MATTNQLRAQELELEKAKAGETARTNRAQEREAHRSNRAREARDAYDSATKRTSAQFKAGTDVGNMLANALSFLKVGKNDESWYSLDKQLVEDTARLPFGTPLGTRQFLANPREAVPGIITLHYIPAIGGEAEGGDANAVNVAASNIYTWVRHKNSGAKNNYEKSDLMIYLLAMSEAYQFHAHLCRAYSVAQEASVRNRYIGKALLTALGFNADSIMSNLADFRKRINLLAVNLNAFAVPKQLPLFARRYWMNTGLFKDAEVHKAQIYAYVPTHYGVFVGASEASASSVVFKSYPSGMTLDDIVTIYNNILNPILADDDIATMSGDILKAYEDGGVYYLDNIADDFHIELTFSMEVLTQITNAVALGEVVSESAIFAQENNVIFAGNQGPENAMRFRWATIGGDEVGSGLSSDGITEPLLYSTLNMHKDAPTPGEVMVATRMAVNLPNVFSDSDTGGVVLAPTSSGTEVAEFFRIWKFGDNGKLSSTNDYSSIQVVNRTLSSDVDEYFNFVPNFAKFDWAPLVVTYSTNTETDADAILEYVGINQDLQNYYGMSSNDLTSMHEVAVLSEYGIPLLGTKMRAAGLKVTEYKRR